MTTISQFYREQLRRTFGGKFGLATALSGLLALVAQPVASIFWPGNDLVGWVPTGLFLIAFLVLLVVGLERAPYQMFTELEAKNEQLRVAWATAEVEN